MIPISLFVVIGAIVVVPRYFKSREREEVQRTVRAAIERGQPLPPEVIEAITRDARPAHTPARDLRRAVIWIAVALAFVTIGYFASWEDGDGWYVGLAFAAIPGFVGLAYLAFSLIDMATRRKIEA
ncbi:MAG TPA: DUF6249 domain-containing protein [Caulobacteraceae bacterium]